MIFFYQRLFLIILATFLAAVSISNRLLASDWLASDWNTLEQGLSYKKITLQEKTIHVFKINPQYYLLKPIVEKETTVKNMTQTSGSLLTINANFFDESGKPLGLVIQDGKELSPFKNISWWGIFYQEGATDHNVAGHIIHSSQLKQTSSIKNAIQAGPRLVVNGTIPKLKTQNSAKSSLGINKKGEIFIVATLSAIDIVELAELMAKPELEGGLGCANALNLDGGSSTQLYAKIGGFELDLPNFATIPVGLGVFKK